MSKRTTLYVSLVLPLICAMAGCKKESGVTSYRAAKEPAPAPVAAPVPMADQGTPEAEARLGWTLPDGWKEDPTPRPMREATLVPGTGTEVAITRLSGNFGEFSANVNRWRGQVGLEPASDAATMQPTIVKTAAGDARVMDFDGPEQSMVVAMIKKGDSTWFIKLTGDKAAVKQAREKFDAMLKSLKWQ